MVVTLLSIIFILHNTNTVMNQIKIGNYVINPSEVLGKGSTGTVYLGIDMRNKAQVAVKVIELKNITNQVTKYLLENEVQALQLSNHPNVLKAHDVIYDSNCCYVVTNYCPNNTLQHYIKARGRIPEDEALKIFKQIVDGYVNLSVNKILHRDLKPSNILFTESYQPVICDFGYCQVSGFLPKPKLLYNVGSPAYMAPESITKNMYSQGSEIWSLGTILYEMLQGRSFAHGRDVMEAVMDIKRRGPYSPDGASEFSRRIIKECMALHPNERIRLKDLIAVLRSGQLSNRSSKGSLSGSPVKNLVNSMSVSIKNSRSARGNITSVPPQMVHHGLENLQMVQQQLQQPGATFAGRNTIQMSQFVNEQADHKYQHRAVRSTLPVQSSNIPPRARSNQPINMQSIKPVAAGTRLSTQPSQPAQQTERFSIPNQHMTNTTQPQIIVQKIQNIGRPGTGRLPFRVPSTVQLNDSMDHNFIANTEVNRTFINPEDHLDYQAFHNASFRSQPVHLNHDMHQESIIQSYPTSFLHANGLDRNLVRGNTIQNINANLMNHNGSVRSLILNPMLSSKRSSNYPQQQQFMGFQSVQQPKSKILKLIQQHNQRQPQQPLQQIQQVQQISQNHHPHFQPVNMSKIPVQTSGRHLQEEINRLAQSPFLKHPSKIQNIQHQIPEVMRSIRPQQVHQMLGSKRQQQFTVPQQTVQVQHPGFGLNLNPLQRQVVVANRR